VDAEFLILLENDGLDSTPLKGAGG